MEVMRNDMLLQILLFKLPNEERKAGMKKGDCQHTKTINEKKSQMMMKLVFIITSIQMDDNGQEAGN